MNESSTSWIAILTLNSETANQKSKQDSEPYILSQEEPTFIGRSNDCQITLKSKYSTASRYHAKVEAITLDGQTVWQVCDLETPNGTFVNNQTIKNCQPLQPGDSLTLGKPRGAIFTFEWKEIEIVKLNDIFRKKHAYDETFVPSQEHLSEREERTHFYADAVNSPDASNNSQNGMVADYQAVPSSTVPPAAVVKNKSLVKPFAASFLALLFLLAIAFLIYRIPESFEARKSREDALRAYVENISRLLIDKKLDSLDPYDADARKARESANGQTIATLKILDSKGKASLLRFLHGAKLIKMQPQKLSKEWQSEENKISKEEVQLSAQQLLRPELLYLKDLTINQSNSESRPVMLLSQSERNQTFTLDKIKSCSVLAQLGQDSTKCAWLLSFKSQSYERPFITPIQLSGADLTGLILKDAPLENINLEGAYLSLNTCKLNLSGNFLEDNFLHKPAHWATQDGCKADLSGSGLQNARLFRSILSGANLSSAKLDFADLRQADLRGANLSGVSWQGAQLAGACYLRSGWQDSFPKQGPDGKPFNPMLLGMKAVSDQDSDLNSPLLFKECKNIEASSPKPLN